MSRGNTKSVQRRGPRLPRATPIDRALLDAGDLDPRTEKALRMRLGVGAGKSHRLEFITTGNAATKERLRQLEARAINGVRRHKMS